MRRRRIALAGVVMLALVTTVTGQQAPKPDFDAATLAWDRGDYVAALTAYKALLAAPGGEKWLEPIALQTGELFQTRELTTDGANPRFSRDGRFVAYETGAGTARLTRVVEPAANMRVAADVKGHSLAFLPQGRQGCVPEAPAVRGVDPGPGRTGEGGPDAGAFRRPAAAELAAVQARRNRDAKPFDRAGTRVPDRRASEVGCRAGR